MLGIDLYDMFHIVNDTTTLKPTTKKNTMYSFDVYQGLYYQCSKNIYIGTFDIPYKDLWTIQFKVNSDQCSVYLDDTLVSTFSLANLTQHKLQYEEDKYADQQWFLWREAKQEYESYIMEHKSTLYDPQIKYSIDQLVPDYPTYNKLMEKFERAEQLCYIEDITIDEYKLALKEIDAFVSPIMRNIVVKHT